jgi:hypothetical protein
MSDDRFSIKGREHNRKVSEIVPCMGEGSSIKAAWGTLLGAQVSIGPLFLPHEPYINSISEPDGFFKITISREDGEEHSPSSSAPKKRKKHSRDSSMLFVSNMPGLADDGKTTEAEHRRSTSTRTALQGFDPEHKRSSSTRTTFSGLGDVKEEPEHRRSGSTRMAFPGLADVKDGPEHRRSGSTRRALPGLADVKEEKPSDAREERRPSSSARPPKYKHRSVHSAGDAISPLQPATKPSRHGRYSSQPVMPRRAELLEAHAAWRESRRGGLKDPDMRGGERGRASASASASAVHHRSWSTKQGPQKAWDVEGRPHAHHGRRGESGRIYFPPTEMHMSPDRGAPTEMRMSPDRGGERRLRVYNAGSIPPPGETTRGPQDAAGDGEEGFWRKNSVWLNLVVGVPMHDGR